MRRQVWLKKLRGLLGSCQRKNNENGSPLVTQTIIDIYNYFYKHYVDLYFWHNILLLGNHSEVLLT